MTSASRFAALVALQLALTCPASAQVHPLVVEARAQYENGEVVSAVETLSRAEHASDLSRDDVLTMLELRILVGRAMGDGAAVERDLLRLVSIAPERPPSDEFPPALREQLAAVRTGLSGQLSVEAHAEATDAGVEVGAEARDDPASVIREVRVHARADDAAWSEGVDRLLLPLTHGRVHYYAVGIGPGGAALAADGSREAPRTLVLEGEAPATPEEGGISPWVWVGLAGGALLVAAVTVIVVLLATSGGDTAQPTAPHSMP